MTFWWPAFSYQEKPVFQARFIEDDTQQEYAGDSSYLEDMQTKMPQNTLVVVEDFQQEDLENKQQRTTKQTLKNPR